jgi:hypothetical protein
LRSLKDFDCLEILELPVILTGLLLEKSDLSSLLPQSLVTLYLTRFGLWYSEPQYLKNIKHFLENVTSLPRLKNLQISIREEDENRDQLKKIRELANRYNVRFRTYPHVTPLDRHDMQALIQRILTR